MTVIIEEDLFSYLKSQSGLTNLVGNRIYPLVAPDDATLPYVVYQKISSVEGVSHSGNSHIAHSRFQFFCVASMYKEAKDIAIQLKLIFHGSTISLDNYKLYAGYKVNELDSYSDESGIFTILIDFMFWHKEI